MLFRLIYDEDLAQAAYLIGCQKTGDAIVVDPERDIDRYLDLAAEHGLKITAVAETHIHADFLSGARELAEKVGAKVYVSGLGGPDWQSKWVSKYDHQILADGDEFMVGNIKLTTVHSPGHTPEHVSYLVTDIGGGADTPMGIITGDFVFVGDLGRPDLLESAAGIEGMMEPSARTLAGTAQAFLKLDDHIQIWPAHGSGSACGKALGAVPQSTVGYEKRYNPALKLATDEQAFVDFILAGQPEPPVYFARMKAWNRDGVPLLGEVPMPKRLAAGDIAGAIKGVRVIDVRGWDAFRDGHLSGANWTTDGLGFLMAVGSYVEADERMVLVCEESQVDVLVRDLVRIGLDKVEAVITPDVFDAYVASGGAVESTPEIPANELCDSLDGPHVKVLDVRRAAENQIEAIEHAVNVAHTRLVPRIGEVPTGDGPIYVHCAGGIRSGMAVSELRRRGFDAVNVAGGWSAMKKAGCTRAVATSG